MIIIRDIFLRRVLWPPSWAPRISGTVELWPNSVSTSASTTSLADTTITSLKMRRLSTECHFVKWHVGPGHGGFKICRSANKIANCCKWISAISTPRCQWGYIRYAPACTLWPLFLGLLCSRSASYLTTFWSLASSFPFHQWRCQLARSPGDGFPLLSRKTTCRPVCPRLSYSSHTDMTPKMRRKTWSGIALRPTYDTSVDFVRIILLSVSGEEVEN